MTDNEIIKALEWLDKTMGSCSSDDEYIYGNIILDLINRQKAEIERLQEYYKLYNARMEEIEELRTEIEHLTGNLKFVRGTVERQLAELKTAKSEARKEFAEELRSKARKYTEYDEGGWDRDVYAVEVAEIDKVLKEKEKET